MPNDLSARLRALANCLPSRRGASDLVRTAADLIDAQAKEIERLKAALTPSAETKAAYIAEFAFQPPCTGCRRLFVPWDTIKEIMKAIRAYADQPRTEEKP